MKVALNDYKEYAVTVVFMKEENQLCIGFTGIKDYNTLRKALTADVLSEIKYYIDDTNYKVYEGFTEIVPTSKVTTTEEGTLDIVMYFNKPDKLTQEINDLRVAVDSLILAKLWVNNYV